MPGQPHRTPYDRMVAACAQLSDDGHYTVISARRSNFHIRQLRNGKPPSPVRFGGAFVDARPGRKTAQCNGGTRGEVFNFQTEREWRVRISGGLVYNQSWRYDLLRCLLNINGGGLQRSEERR